METTNTSPVPRLERLDVLRALAILSVFGHHLFYHVLIQPGIISIGWVGAWKEITAAKYSWCWIFYPLHLGGVGVTLFFVISGFCIHLTFLQWTEKRKEGSSFWKQYFARRFFRIYPPYALSMVIFLLIESHTNKFESATQITSHLLLVHNYQSETFFAINPSYWSLAVEFQLYLVYPLFLCLIRGFGFRYSIAWFCLVGIISGYLQSNSESALAFFLTKLPFAFWFNWGLGAFLCDLYYTRTIKIGNLGIAASITIAGAIFATHFKPCYCFSGVLFQLGTALFCGWYILNKKALSLVERLLVPFGIISYSFYLLHQPFIVQIIPRLQGRLLGPSSLLSMTLGGVLTFLIISIISWAFYHLVEVRSQNLGKKLALNLA